MRTYSTHELHVRANAIRVGAFVALSALLASLILLVLGTPSGHSAATYRAIFTNVAGLEKGSEVRAAGVEVGTVTDLQLRDSKSVLVTFGVKEGITLTEATRAQIRFANLTGDRYLELTSPRRNRGANLPDGATIGASRTTGSLDLDLVFNGFRPLTRALDPQAVNELTSSLIAVSQGQGAAVNELLDHVGSLTNTLGDRASIVGQVINNLAATLDTVDDRRGDLGRLINGLDGLMRGLAKDRKRIGQSLESLSHMTVEGTDFLRTVRPALKQTIDEVRRTAVVFNNNSTAVDRYLPQLPTGVKALGRGGAYGSFFNFYLCGVRFKTDGTSGPQYTPFFLAEEYRCQF